jgi:hypothetical protein
MNKIFIFLMVFYMAIVVSPYITIIFDFIIRVKSTQIKCNKNGVKTSLFVVALTILISKFIQIWEQKKNR